MRLLVAGGRDYADKERVFRELDAIHLSRRVTLLIQGGGTGADALAKEWAKSRRVPWRAGEYRAAWEDLSANPALIRTRRDGRLYNALAGGERNQRMLDRGRPDVVLAFPGGKGTFDVLKRAYAARRGGRPELEIVEIKDEGYRR